MTSHGSLPATLCRYRPLTDAFVEREIGALREGYLFAPLFREMNDPMEAFYALGKPEDRIVDAIVGGRRRASESVFELLREAIGNFALVSFAREHLNYPLWAYYASNFAGMCLEFSTPLLAVGGFAREHLLEVEYAIDPLPALGVGDVVAQNLEAKILPYLSRKRVEWRHEGEWRFLAGARGARHYLDDALIRVFLGPRMETTLRQRVCETLDRRPTEVLAGRIEGFELRFEAIKPARPWSDCDRTGRGICEPTHWSYQADELGPWLSVPYDELIALTRTMALHPNLDEIEDVGISGDRQNEAIFIWLRYKDRFGRDVREKRYFDRSLERLS